MKAKMVHLIANLFIWIAVIAGLGGLATALALNLFTDYIPEMWHFLAIGGGMLLLILIGVLIHVIANARAKREAIRECWDVVEDADAIDAVEEEAVVEAVEEVEPEVVEETEEIADGSLKAKIQAIRVKIVEKTPLTEEQLEKVEKVGKVAVPVGIACITMLAMASKIKTYKAGEARRRSFYNWLG